MKFNYYIVILFLVCINLISALNASPELLILDFQSEDGLNKEYVKSISNQVKHSLQNQKKYEIVNQYDYENALKKNKLSECFGLECGNLLEKELSSRKILTGTVSRTENTCTLTGILWDKSKKLEEFSNEIICPDSKPEPVDIVKLKDGTIIEATKVFVSKNSVEVTTKDGETKSYKKSQVSSIKKNVVSEKSTSNTVDVVKLKDGTVIEATKVFVSKNSVEVTTKDGETKSYKKSQVSSIKKGVATEPKSEPESQDQISEFSEKLVQSLGKIAPPQKTGDKFSELDKLEGTNWFPLGIGIWSPFSINDNGNPKILQFNFIYGTAIDMYGLNVGFVNHIRRDMWGAQYGVVNFSDRDMWGAQAGLWNKTERNMNGLQLGGVFNFANNMNGIQISGFINSAHTVNVEQTMNGIQIAGFLNGASYMKGIQLSGIFNGASYMKGIQLGLLVNGSHNSNGLQISLINITSNIHTGLSVGAINSAGSLDQGYQISAINYVSDTIHSGMQLGGFNNAGFNMSLQWGVINVAKDSKDGFQVGVLNYTSGKAKFQLGFLNIALKNRIPVFPIVNFDF